MKDTQKHKAHAAQQAFVGRQKVFLTVEEAQVYLDERIRTKWFRSRWPELAELGMVIKPLVLTAATKTGWSFEEKVRRIGKYSSTFFPLLYFPMYQTDLFQGNHSPVEWNELLLWHQVAHYCAKTVTHHRSWAKSFLNLAAHFISTEASRELRERFRSHKVHFTLRKPITDEQRQRLQERARLQGFGGRKAVAE